MTGGLAALFFLFNTGQLSSEKTKLVNTADAVAYSAGVMHARTLNYEAYANRAMMANTVAIAQLVSLSSWVRYTNNLATFGVVLETPKFALYYPSYLVAQFTGLYVKELLIDSDALKGLALGSDKIIREVLMNAQLVAYGGLVPARREVMNQVAQANYLGDGAVAVDDVPMTGNEFTSFVSNYADADRTRFAEVAKTAAYRDRFLPKRSWTLPGLWSDCPGATATGRVDWLDRRGGTELLGFEEWKAMDTLSEKRWVPKSKTDVMCMAIAEVPAGWGLQGAAANPSIDLNLLHYDQSVIVNPAASTLAIATSSAWDYSGLPNFYDLSEAALGQADPRLKFSIRVRRRIDQTRSSEGRSDVRPSPQLNAYRAAPAGGDELVALASSEVYFERPPGAHENAYGASVGTPREIGSLFNPYWQVRLVQTDPSLVKAAQLLQGVVMP